MLIYDYHVTMTADVPVREAFLKYIDAHLMKDWQPNLIRIETVKGLLFHEGSSGYIIYQAGDHEMKMQVDVHQCKGTMFDVTYQVPGIINRCVNHFTTKDDKLLWKMDVNFQFIDANVPEKAVFKVKTKAEMQQFIRYIKNESI